MRIGILTKDFLNLSGARDFLRMIIQGLKVRRENEFFLLIDRSDVAFDLKCNNILFKDFNTTRTKYVKLQRFICQFGNNLRNKTNIFFTFQTNRFLKFKTEKLLGRNTIRGLHIIPYTGITNGLNNTISKIKIDAIIPSLISLPIPFVSYLYDCQHKYFPEYFNENEFFLRDKLFQNLIDSSLSMIVNSKDTKKDLIKFFKVDEKKIIPLPFTPQLETGVLMERPEILIKYKLPPKYFLISNQFWIHKSLETSIEALKILINNGLKDCHIVFTGKMEDPRFPEYVPKFLKQVKNINIEENTTFLGYIPKREQLEIMKNSVAVIQTSLFEGGPGGGAIYDAVALGVRAIVSNIPVNRELPRSKMLVLFDSKNVDDLVNKMSDFWNENYIRPDNQTLLRLNQHYIKRLSDTLYAAINLACRTQRI